MLEGGICRRQRELLAEPQTRVAEGDCSCSGRGRRGRRGRNQDGFLQLSKLLLPIIVLRLACLTFAAERANAEN